MNLLQIHEPGQTPLPHADTLAVGIDLGTTHSVVAIGSKPSPHAGEGWVGGGSGSDGTSLTPLPNPPPQGGREVRAEVIHNIHGHALVPSVVYYAPDGSVEVGYPAKKRGDEGQANVIASIKRRMADAGEKINVGNREVTPVEVSAEILKELKRNAERALGKTVDKAVITVPAYFDDAARAATKDAARLAGLEVLRLINEPTAAALAYGLDNDAQGIYAIYDLGGGTFDVSVLKLEQGVFQVLATSGDTQLGGDDFDAAIAAWLLTELGLSDTSIKSEDVGVLVALAREAKHRLCTPSSTGALSAAGDLVQMDKDPQRHDVPPRMTEISYRDKNIALTRDTLDELIIDYVEKTIRVCEQALADAKLTRADIKGVVMVGGSTRVPLVIEKVREFFGKTPLTDVNPDEVVAIGAALQAQALTQGSDNLLLDVIPLSLGLETMGGLTEKLIERNTPIPTRVAQEFTTYQDGQSGMQIHVVQGEREMSAHNRSLGRFELSGIPPLPAGIARVNIIFTVDADGLLTVSAEEKTTGIHQHIVVKPSYGLAPEQMEKMLLDSMQNAQKDIMERLLVEARVEAQRQVVELESALKADGGLLNEAEKKILLRQMQVVKNASEGDDRDYIDVELQQLAALAGPFAQRRMDRAIGGALKGAHIDKVASD